MAEPPLDETQPQPETDARAGGSDAASVAPPATRPADANQSTNTDSAGTGQASAGAAGNSGTSEYKDAAQSPNAAVTPDPSGSVGAHQDDLKTRAAQAAALLKAAPGTPASDVALARYFGMPPNAVAAHRDECTRQFVAENQESLVQQLMTGGNPYLSADNILGGLMPDGPGVRPTPRQGGAQGPQAIAANPQANDAVQTMRAEMKLSGFNLNPAPGSAQEKQLAQVESGLRDRIVAAQQAKNGVSLTNDEVQNLAMGYYADQVLKGGKLGNSGGGKQPPAQAASKQAFSNPLNITPQGAPVAAGTMAEQRVQDAPTLTLEEFNNYAKVAKNLEHRSNQAAQDKKKLAVTPEEQKQLVEMQQRLGIKQTGTYDNATRHALQAAFIDLIRPAAEEQEKKYGIPAAITIGQAILESGYGCHIPTDANTGERSNNFFGIKPDKKGQPFVNAMTHEYDKKGNLVPKIQPFAVYDGIDGSIQEHSAFLKRNANYRTLFSTADPEKWAQGLQDAGYGGRNNKAYADALIKAMRMWKLIK